MIKRIMVLFICCLLWVYASVVPWVYADDICEDEALTEDFFSIETAVPANRYPIIDAAAAIVVDIDSGRILFEKNARSKRAIASTTKIMTAIIALERGDLEDTVTVSKRSATIWGSTLGLKGGQQLKLEELLYGLLLRSGNDAAIAIAEHIGSTVEGFAEMMNEKAREIGAYDTNFRTPHGLDVNDHYSTAYDLGLIARYALKNPTFSKIVGTRSTAISTRELYNTNEMLSIYPGADGVKTGYTGKAGRCLVTSATRDNWRIVSVVLGCASRTKRAQSSRSILDYGFNNFKPYTLLQTGEQVSSLPVVKGLSSELEIRSLESIRFPLKEEEFKSLKKEIILPEALKAPVYKGTDIGIIRFLLEGRVIGESPLITGSSVSKKGFYRYIEELLFNWEKIMRQGLMP